MKKIKKKDGKKIMKKLIKLVLVSALIGLIAIQNYSEHYYIKDNCKVLMIGDSIATVQDSNGEIYNIKVNNINVGDTVKLKMLSIDGKIDGYNEPVKIIKK